MNKKICKHPFMSLSIMLTGNVSPCCAYSGKLANINDVDNLDNFFKNNQSLVDLRNKEINGEWYLPGCSTCERTPATSRKANFNAWADREFPPISITNPVLRHIDVSFSNTCNMTCVMCSNSYSSAWADYDDQLSAKNKWPVRREWSMTREQIDKLVDSLDTVKILEIKGGEPFFDPNFKYMLEKLVEKDYRELEIVIMTNFTCIDNEHIALLNRLRKLYLTISIDGEGEVYSWVRGFSFSKLEHELLEKLPQLSRHYIEINFTSSIYNIQNIESFYNWMGDIVDKTGALICINFAVAVTWPEYLNPNLLVDRTESLRQINSIFSDPRGCNRNIPYFQLNLSVLKNHLLKDTISDPILIDKFTQWNNYLTKMRGSDLYSKIISGK